MVDGEHSRDLGSKFYRAPEMTGTKALLHYFDVYASGGDVPLMGDEDRRLLEGMSKEQFRIDLHYVEKLKSLFKLTQLDLGNNRAACL